MIRHILEGINKIQKLPVWNIKTQKWEGASKEYIEAQEDILYILKQLTIHNTPYIITEYNLDNRDFDIYYDNKLILKSNI